MRGVMKSNFQNLSKLNKSKMAEKKLNIDRAFVIAIAGGSASGKTTIAKKIIKHLGISEVGTENEQPVSVSISMDSFYRNFTPAESKAAFENNFDFDCPEAFDFALLKTTLMDLKAKRRVDIPVYNFAKHSREPEQVVRVDGALIVLFDGILAFHDKEIAELCDLKIFVDTDPDIRLARRLQRDTAERGRDLAGVIKQYENFVKPSYERYIEPSKALADIIVPRGGSNTVAINLIVQHLYNQIVSPLFKRSNGDARAITASGVKRATKRLCRLLSASCDESVDEDALRTAECVLTSQSPPSSSDSEDFVDEKLNEDSNGSSIAETDIHVPRKGLVSTPSGCCETDRGAPTTKRMKLSAAAAEQQKKSIEHSSMQSKKLAAL